MVDRDKTRTYSRKESVVFLKTNEPFGGLSNMAGGYPIHVNGLRILTSEALYQSCRFPHLPDVQKMIIGQISPMTAKMRSKPYRKDSRSDWDQVRVRIMRWCLRMKLVNNWNTFSALLLRTGERPIVEESRKDDFWGAKAVDNGETLVGMNVLGRLLMELREQLKQQEHGATFNVAPPDVPQFLLLGRPIDVGSGLPPPQVAAVQEQFALFKTDATDIDEATSPVDPPAAAPSFKAVYEGYRPARMRWLPPVPEHWTEQRAKIFFREVDERSKTGQEELLSVSHLTGVTPRSQKNVTMFKAASYVGSKLCRPGDIVINTLWAWMGALGASRHVGIVSPAYGVYRPHRADSFNPAYLDYLLRTRAYVAEYIGRSTGIRSSRLRLYPNQFLDIALIQPPRTEQDQIVAYLRAQDAHIARFIKAKRELIGLLTEQKLRIIDHAVTRGLNASIALKPSGIEWSGDVPAHWSIKPLKRWVRLNASTLGERTNPDFEFRYVDIGSVKTSRLARELERLRFENAPSRARRLLRRGDTIISTVRTYLKAIWYVNEDADNLIASTGFAVLTPGQEVEPEYLGYVIQSTGFVNRVTANSIGIAYPAIAETVLGRFPVVMPSTLEEQRAILTHIKAESAPLDQAIEQALTEIKLIREYRDRQIADVVTGQVDVRGWVPGTDDVVAEEDLAALGGDEEIDTDGEEHDGDD